MSAARLAETDHRRAMGPVGRMVGLVPIVALLAVVLAPPAARAEEGMWPFDNLPLEHLKDTYGFAPTKPWLDHVMRASARLTVGCSGSFVSASGLLLTNHHCVEDCLQQLSSGQHDLLREGFLARTRAQERRCPDFSAERLEEITDVTARLAQATRGTHGADFARRRTAEISRIESECAGSQAECQVVDLYGGAMQHLYRYHRFDDVRVVFAPEIDIAQFGGDPDNYEFPRYDLDMAIMRVYEASRPATVADSLRLRDRPAVESEFTLTSGSPGRTQRQLTVAQLETLRDIENPWRLLFLAEQRGLVTRYAQESTEHARIAKGPLDDIENSFKGLWGEQAALAGPQTLEAKRAEERRLREAAATREEFAPAGAAWDEIAAAERVRRDLSMRLRFTEGAQGAWSRYFEIARNLVREAAERPRPDDERLPEFSNAQIGATEQATMSSAPLDPGFERMKLAWSLAKLREWLGADDPLVRRVLGRESPDVLAARWVAQTRLADVAQREALWRGGQHAVGASADPFIRLASLLEPESRALRLRLEAEVDAPERRAAQRIAQVRFSLSGTAVYPDATSTPRMSFGVVEGWNDRGHDVPFTTTLAGLYDRATDFDPFRLPRRWVDARPRMDPAAPMNFVTTNDIVGGNSGSPVLDRQGDIVGLAFDGNLDSLGGAFFWDEAHNRMVAVQAAFILEALGRVYHADELLAELK